MECGHFGMMGIVILLVTCVVITIAIFEVARHLGRDVSGLKFQLFASSLIPMLFIALWIFGIWWIQSDHCPDPNSCDAPGMMIMSFGTLGGAVFSLLVCLITSVIWNRWFINR